MKKFTKTATVLLAVSLSSTCISGCSNANQSKEESKASPPIASIISAMQGDSEEILYRKPQESSIAPDLEVSSSESSNEEEELFTLDDAIAYGRTTNTAYAYKASDEYCAIALGIYTRVAILSTDDPKTYDFIYKGYRYVIEKKDRELFPDDYVPDPSDERWFTVLDQL